jgi:hypothetical protein
MLAVGVQLQCRWLPGDEAGASTVDGGEMKGRRCSIDSTVGEVAGGILGWRRAAVKTVAAAAAARLTGGRRGLAQVGLAGPQDQTPLGPCGQRELGRHSKKRKETRWADTMFGPK